MSLRICLKMRDMLKKVSLFSCFIFSVVFCNAQQKQIASNNINQFADLTATFGSSQGSTALSYVHNWRLGKSKKFELGIGVIMVQRKILLQHLPGFPAAPLFLFLLFLQAKKLKTGIPLLCSARL